MNRLLVDIGNSRIKWAVARDARMGPMRAVDLSQFRHFSQWLATAPAVESVEAVCVAGAKREALLRSALRRHGLPVPRFARSTEHAAGVTNGYAESWRLGADRWVAAIGAWHEADGRHAVCSISVGTALTVDVVDAKGIHRGGVIAPGPVLMVRSLLGQTHGIAVRAANSRSRSTRRPTRALPPLAGNTRDAIYQGSLTAAAALVDRCVRDVAAGLRARPRVYVTGGAAASLAPLLECTVKHQPDLVLRGLLALARARQ